jgi:GT2 family glycosyltransferase
MKPSGFRWISVNPGKISRSDFMDTCCSSIKRKILDDFSFDENLGSYAVMEDLDFSIPVGRRHKIISHPDLRYFHNHSKSGRISRREDQKKFVFNHYYVYRKHMRKNLLTLFLHGWSHVGIVIDVVLYSIKSRSTDLLLGTIDAHGNIFKHMATGKFPDPSIKKPNS